MIYAWFAISLFLTIIIEESIALLLGNRTKTAVLVVALVNLITNPIAVMISLKTGAVFRGLHPKSISYFVLEICVILFEGYIYHLFYKKKIFRTRPSVLSVVLNVTSAMSGVVISSMLH